MRRKQTKRKNTGKQNKKKQISTEKEKEGEKNRKNKEKNNLLNEIDAAEQSDHRRENPKDSVYQSSKLNDIHYDKRRHYARNQEI